jgi:hypothetical protein
LNLEGNRLGDTGLELMCSGNEERKKGQEEEEEEEEWSSVGVVMASDGTNKKNIRVYT